MSDKRLRPLIVPIFIPFQGCPHRCVFCEQERITSRTVDPVDAEEVGKILDIAIASRNFHVDRNPEIAFFGGTFTGLDFDYMLSLLEATVPYMERGQFSSIRISTRPDSLDDDRVEVLKEYGVRTVELGVQSMDDKVLQLSRRGHSSQDTRDAFCLLKDEGFRAGMQLMPGLPGDSEEVFARTIDEVVRLKPDMVRLYPALVIQGTVLATWYNTGKYVPLGLEDAVRICAEACRRLEGNGIPVIRLGLMSSPTLLEEGQIIAGPWHNAFGFLVRSLIFRESVLPYLPNGRENPEIALHVSPGEVCLLQGFRKEGLRWLEKMSGSTISAVSADSSISPGRIRVETL